MEVLELDEIYHPLPGGRVRRLKRRFDAKSFCRKLLSSKFDLIEFYGGDFGWLIKKLKRHKVQSLLVAHTNGLELLATQQEKLQSLGRDESVSQRLTSSIIQRCDEISFKYTDRFISLCDLDRDFVVENGFYSPNHTTVIEPGIDDEFRLCTPAGPKRTKRVAYVGTWTERKDPSTILGVIESIASSREDVTFEMIGTGLDKSELLLKLSPRAQQSVVVHPKLCKAEMVEVLRRCMVFFFPSLYEGYGMATAEAMACGCVPVVTPTGFGAMITNNTDGIVCDFRDVEQMSCAIESLLDNEARRSTLSARARLRVSELSWPNQCTKLHHVYSQWVSEHLG